MARTRKPKVTFERPDEHHVLVFLDGAEVGFLDRYEAEEIETGLYATRTLYRWRWEPISEDHFQSQALQEPAEGVGYRRFTSVEDAEKQLRKQGLQWYTLPQMKKAIRELLQKTSQEDREAAVEEAVEWTAARDARVDPRKLEIP